VGGSTAGGSVVLLDHVDSFENGKAGHRQQYTAIDCHSPRE
jgi:hypothetical protein